MYDYRKRETLKEVAQKYKQAGSCKEDFKNTLVKAGKLGFFGGFPFGVYVAYRMQHKTVKGFVSKVFFTSIASTFTMGALGIIVGTYNCLVMD